MQNLVVFICLFIFLICLIIVLVYYVFNFIHILFSTTKKAPYVPTFNKQLELMKQLKLKGNALMVDLGCGDGKALRFFSKEHGIKLGEGFDINFYAIFRGKILNKYYKIVNINLYRKNFFEVDIKKYDYIYVYLLATQLAAMEDRIWEKKDNDAVIISNSFTFKKHKPFKIYKNKKGVDTIFLYK